jgi:hypothetical protein
MSIDNVHQPTISKCVSWCVAVQEILCFRIGEGADQLLCEREREVSGAPVASADAVAAGGNDTVEKCYSAA